MISLTGIQGGAGHGGNLLLFKNTGPTCIVHGYPGLDAVATDGSIVESAARTPNGYLGGINTGSPVPVVILKTGQTASALFEGLTGPTPGGGACAPYAALITTPPNETHSVRLPSSYTLCYLQIHPVVSGTAGGAAAP
jgi:hypothetical protein